MLAKFVCVDLETSDRVVANAQILSACFIILDENLFELERRTFNVRPRYWDRFAEESVAIHGITKERAMAFNCRSTVARRMLDFIPENGMHLVCHANRKAGTFGVFDRQVLSTFFLDGFLNREGVDHFEFDRKCPANKVISTHSLARKFLSLQSYSLDSVCRQLGIALEHHNAESDANACVEILRRYRDTDFNKFAEDDFYGIGAVDSTKKKRVKPKPGVTSGQAWHEPSDDVAGREWS